MKEGSNDYRTEPERSHQSNRTGVCGWFAGGYDLSVKKAGLAGPASTRNCSVKIVDDNLHQIKPHQAISPLERWRRERQITVHALATAASPNNVPRRMWTIQRLEQGNLSPNHGWAGGVWMWFGARGNRDVEMSQRAWFYKHSRRIQRQETGL